MQILSRDRPCNDRMNKLTPLEGDIKQIPWENLIKQIPEYRVLSSYAEAKSISLKYWPRENSIIL